MAFKGTRTKPEMLRIAIQKSGRLSDDSISLLRECGIDILLSRGNAKLTARATNFPLELLFLRDDDIPGYIADGVVDAGIVGENVLIETGRQLVVVEQLGFAHCRLSLAIPRGEAWNGLEDLRGKRIATSYPHILQSYLQENGIEATIHEISGSVEIAPGIGLADAICDIVGTGSTLISNGLVEVEEVLSSQAVLVANPHVVEKINGTAYRGQILERLRFRIQAVKQAARTKYIVLNAPNHSLKKIIELLPGIKSPSVMPLADEGWSAVHSVVQEGEFWEIIEKLKEAGAEGILVVPVEKIVT
jgi:ATP phosphoribosyltransferase